MLPMLMNIKRLGRSIGYDAEMIVNTEDMKFDILCVAVSLEKSHVLPK